MDTLKSIELKPNNTFASQSNQIVLEFDFLDIRSIKTSIAVD